ncbi:hypothetical protein VNO80_15675 [Phaseolus coccineus]|uniref:B-like cyclin n=1 Tax=Phaseolus coccineus TaxID=3886 RepID=A0AAN9R364_PHACN
MAANFWTSSHYKHFLDQEDVDMVNALDKEKGITLEDFKLIKMHLANLSGSEFVVAAVILSFVCQGLVSDEFLMLLLWISSGMLSYIKYFEIGTTSKSEAEGEKGIATLLEAKSPMDKQNMKVVATAVTYMRRVYTKKSMAEYDPRLVAPTCLYLASKAEESTVQARLLVFYIKKLYADEKYRYEIKDILEMEMKILEALNYYLVVYHPYRCFRMQEKEGKTKRSLLCCLALGLVNDTYKMDLILVHPPHLIALACIYIASVLRDKDTTAWFEELRVDMNVVSVPCYMKSLCAYCPLSKPLACLKVK